MIEQPKLAISVFKKRIASNYNLPQAQEGHNFHFKNKYMSTEKLEYVTTGRSVKRDIRGTQR